MLNFRFTVSKANLFVKHEKTEFDAIRMYDEIATPTAEYGLNHPNVQRIIHSKDLHFDLIINEDMFHESWLMFAYKFNAPIVTICELSIELFCFNLNLNFYGFELAF